MESCEESDGNINKKTPTKIVNNGEIVTNPKEIAKTMNNYFTQKIHDIKKQT